MTFEYFVHPAWWRSPGQPHKSFLLGITLLLQRTAGHSTAQHSKADQRTAKPPWKHGRPANHTAQLFTGMHTHSTAQLCSTAHSREVQHTPQCPQRTPEHGVLPALPNHILESFMCLWSLSWLCSWAFASEGVTYQVGWDNLKQVWLGDGAKSQYIYIYIYIYISEYRIFCDIVIMDELTNQIGYTYIGEKTFRPLTYEYGWKRFSGIWSNIYIYI